MPEIDTKLIESKYPKFLSQYRDQVETVVDFRGDVAVTVKKEKIREILRFLKEDSETQFNMMTDLFGMDYLTFNPEPEDRFAVIYILYSMNHHVHLRIKVSVPESDPEVDSIHDLYKAANWFEREAWDLFGIRFRGHPNLIRILCHNDFEGHALRKDYPSDQYQRLKAAAPSSGL